MTPGDDPHLQICWTTELRREDVARLKIDVERTAYWHRLGINAESAFALQMRRQIRVACEYGLVHTLMLSLEAGEWRRP